jgi:uncharacterized membrane protein YfcA
MAEPVVLFLAGIGIGALGTLIGAGGGWMVVPLLLLGFDFDPQNAVGTSLTVVFLNALSGSLAYLGQRRVLIRMALAFGLSTVPGALIGVRLIQHVGSTGFSVLFGVFLLSLAAFLYQGHQLALFSRYQSAAHGHEDIQSLRSPHMRLGILVSFLVGLLSSVFGVGGGIVHVPFLIIVLGLPVHNATATSQLALGITSLTGMLGFLWQGQVVIPAAASMGFGVMIGAQLGAHFSRRVSSQLIRRILAVLLMVFAIRLILRVVY